MKRFRTFIGLLSVLLAAIVLIVVLRASEPSSPGNASNAAEHRRPKRTDTDEGPIDITQLNYHDPSIKTIVAEMDRLAEERAGQEWLHDPWHQRRHRPDYHDYTAVWGTQTTPGGFISNTWQYRPAHIVRLIASPQIKNVQVVWSASVIASWYPDGEKAWGAHMNFSTSLFSRPRDVQRDNFNILFKREGTFNLGLPGRGYYGKRKFGDVEYSFGFTESPASDRDIRPYIESPESMRDQAIAVIDDIEDRLYKEIPSGKVIFSLRDPKLPIPDRLNDHEGPLEPVLQSPFPDRYQPTLEQRDEMLEQAIKELEERKRIWREDYRALYAAVDKAFPVKRLFAVEKK